MDPNDGGVIVESLPEPTRFAAIFDRHYDAVYWFVARRVGASLAADLAAETFARAFAGRRRYRPRRAAAHGRGCSGLPSTCFGTTTEPRRASFELTPGPASIRCSRQRRMWRGASTASAGPRLAEALAALRPAERDVLLLFAWADIAEALELEVDGTFAAQPRSRACSGTARRRRARSLRDRSVDTAEGPVARETRLRMGIHRQRRPRGRSLLPAPADAPAQPTPPARAGPYRTVLDVVKAGHRLVFAVAPAARGGLCTDLTAPYRSHELG